MTLRVRADGLLFALVLALVVSLPFEPVRPAASLGPFAVNHIKVLLAATAVLWLYENRRWTPGALYRRWRDTQVAGLVLFLGVATLAAVLAPSFSREALKFVGRLASGLFVVLLARQIVAARPDRLTPLLWAISSGTSASALLGFGEVAGLPQIDPVLAKFKLAPTHVGGDLRLSASFQYATIAAMYFELAAPLAVVLAVTSRRLWQRVVATGLAAACSVATALTITRAGVVALGAAFAFMLALAWIRPRLRELGIPTALAAAASGIVLVNLALRLPDFNTRFGTENDWGWYAASYSVPASLSLEQGAPTQTVVTARNTGQAVWTAAGDHPFALAYRWLSADARSQMSLPPTIVSLPGDVQPGQSVDLSVDIVARRLPPGDYRLAWGMLEQRVLWFHDRGYPDAETSVHVAPGAQPSAAQPTAVTQQPRTDTEPGLAPVPRSDLWAAAIRMFSEHPWLGVGPDNFRHVYGTYLGMAAWDDRVHANNLYLELLADVGLLGAFAFGLVVAPAIIGVARSIRLFPSVWLIGFGASLIAFFVHGTLDYFLDYTPVYVLFWLIVGLSTAVSHHLEKQC